MQIRTRQILLNTCFVAFIIAGCNKTEETISISKIQCNYKVSPIGVSNPVRFNWVISSDQRKQYQSAYQILISDNKEDIDNDKGNIWDSEIVKSGTSVGILKDDLNLQPGKRYYWKVKIWDKNNVPSAWSKPGSFITGLFQPEDWDKAQWISMEEMDDSLLLVPGMPTWGKNTKNIATRRPIVPMFRKEFSLNKKIKSAFLFISGLGQYKAWVNGSQVSSDFLSPGWTHYQKTCLYNIYDITDLVEKGDNAIGVVVGNGFYNINNERYRKMLITYGMPKMIAKIMITYTDGSIESVVSGKDWKVTSSPITFTSIYGGENYDARLEQEDWDQPDFDDKAWRKVLLAKAPGGKLIAETTYPVKVMETFSPKRVVETGKDSFMIDFGQNASGIFKIKVKGNKGDTVTIVPSELINEDNTAFQRFTGSPHYYQYILKGDGVETWQPRFSYYGFRYVQVYGAQPTDFYKDRNKPKLLDITMLHTYNSAPHTGSFWCSNELFNQIDTLIRYGMQSNIQSLISDCPHREKLGWIEQTYLLGGSLQYNFDMYHLFSKLVRDMMDTQRKSGLIGSTAPEFIVFGDDFTDSPEWGSAIVQIPWLIYKLYGDISLVNEAWDSMLAYMNYLDSKAENNILSYGLGDWYDLGPNPPGWSQLSPIATTATAIYYDDYMVLAKIARHLYKKSESKEFLKKAEEIKNAYNKLLFDPKNSIYGRGSQTSMAIPLSMGIVEEQYREKVLQNLVDSILLNNKALTTGDIGYHYLIDALTRGNQSQLIYDMNNRFDVPGYGYQIRKGATALTESWDALREKSNNHMMLGHIEEWFYTGLGGIRQVMCSEAYKNIIIDPTFVSGLEEVKTKYNSPHGTIKSAWKNEAGEITMKVSIPVNTTAKVYLPSGDTSKIKENGININTSPDIEISNKETDLTVVKIGSGNYVFQIQK